MTCLCSAWVSVADSPVVPTGTMPLVPDSKLPVDQAVERRPIHGPGSGHRRDQSYEAAPEIVRRLRHGAPDREERGLEWY